MIETAGVLPVCTLICNIKEVTMRDAHPEELKAYIIKGWSHKNEDVAQDIQKYWPIGHELSMIDCVAVKGR